MSNNYTPIAFCFQQYGNSLAAINKCPSGLECCQVFSHHRSDCGPKAYCEEQKSGSRTLMIVIVVVICCCIAAASAINLYFRRKRMDPKNNTQVLEVEFSRMDVPGDENVFHKEP